MWHTFPLIGQVIKLDPSSNSYTELNRGHAKGDLGVIVNMHNPVGERKIIDWTKGTKNIGINVQWQNGYRTDVSLSEVLPVHSVFVDFKVISNQPYTTERIKRIAEGQVLRDGSITPIIHNAALRKRTLASRVELASHTAVGTEAQAKVLERLLYNTKLELDAEEVIIPIDVFFSWAEVLYRKEESGDISREDMEHIRTFEPTTDEFKWIVLGAEREPLYRIENPFQSVEDLVDNGILYNRPQSVTLQSAEEALQTFRNRGVRTPTPPPEFIPQPTGISPGRSNRYISFTNPVAEIIPPTIVQDAGVMNPLLLRHDESYDEWLSRMIADNNIITMQDMELAQQMYEERSATQENQGTAQVDLASLFLDNIDV